MKIGIATSSFGSISDEPIKILLDNNFQIIFNDTKQVVNEDWLIKNFSDCDAVIAGTEIYNQKVLSHLSNLKIISRLGVGVDNLDIEYAKKKNIKISIVATTPELSVAELVLSYILSISRETHNHHFDLKHNLKWKKRMGGLVTGKVLGIIGLGKIGKRLVNLVSGFNMKILVHDINPDHNFILDNKINLVSFDTLINQSDYITIHVDSLGINSNMFNKNTFLKMKKNSTIINTSRGSLINEYDLYEALKKKIIGFAALDVFKNEPYTGNLINLDNVILTPHIGSYAREIRLKMECEASDNIINFIMS